MILILGSNNTLPNVPPRIVHRDRIGSNPSNLKPVDQRKAYQNNAILRQVRHSRDNIPNESLILVEIIGEGEFGTVYKGKNLKSFEFLAFLLGFQIIIVFFFSIVHVIGQLVSYQFYCKIVNNSLKTTDLRAY